MIHPQTSSGSSHRQKLKQRHHRRNQLQYRLCYINNLICFLALSGIILMIIENEFRFYRQNDYRSSFTSWFIKLIITLSTIVLLLLIIYYHYLNVNLEALTNSFVSVCQGLTFTKLFLILIELVICSIHPYPYRSFTVSNTTSVDSITLSSIDLDIALGLPMFLRLYLLCRLLMFYSYLYTNGSSQCLGSLNRVPINVLFLFKTYLEQYPTRCLSIFVILMFCIGSWSLRVCNYRSATEHLTIFDSMWLFFVTFTTVGYGDIIPSTYCGRSIAMINAMIGILSSALLISVLTQKLGLNRWEKYVYHLILNIQSSREQKDHAANVIKFAMKLWYLRRTKTSSTLAQLRWQWKLFRSIRYLQEVKQTKRNLSEQCVVLADVYNLQRNEMDQIELMREEINEMKLTLYQTQERLIEFLNRFM